MIDKKDTLVISDIGMIELDNDDIEEKFSYRKTVDNLFDSCDTIEIPEDMGKKLIETLKKEASKKRKKEKIKRASEFSTNDIEEIKKTINNYDSCSCDGYEEEDF